MKVLVTANSLMPEYGGPAYSVSRLALALSQIGIEVGLWAADASALATPLIDAQAPIARYGGREAEALGAFGRPDVLHDNGVWMPHHHRLAALARKLAIPRVVSTRGMLEPWALNHKRLKKRLAWLAYQRRDLRTANRHHVTSAAEAENVRALRLQVPVTLIPNGVDVPVLPARALARAAEAGARPRIALFLGRIYPVKGLPMLVDAWARVRPAGWRLHIVGPDEAGHQAYVEKRISAAGLGDDIRLLGPVTGGAKAEAFAAAELFILPTHSENFGMAIGEALAHGVPVLTTTAAPWPQLESRGCGWRVSPSVDALAAGLAQATRLTPGALAAMGAVGRELIAADFGWGAIAHQFGALYEMLRTGGAEGRASERR